MTEPLQDPYLAAPIRTRRTTPWGTMLLLALLAFALGGGTAGWVVWHGGLGANGLNGAGIPAAPRWAIGQGPAPAPQAVSSTPAAALDPAAQARLALLEQRLDQLNRQADAAEANTARAEALLVAFATRRATERGAPLGYLEDQLRLRFGDALPHAVAMVVAAQKAPVTLDQLAARLRAMAPVLVTAPGTSGGWGQLRDQFANLFVLRHASAPAPSPTARIDHAELALREGRTEDAIADVMRLPGAAGANDWVAAARHYAEVEQALDLLETTALLEPRKLRDGKGRAVTQPAPFAAVAPGSGSPG